MPPEDERPPASANGDYWRRLAPVVLGTAAAPWLRAASGATQADGAKKVTRIERALDRHTLELAYALCGAAEPDLLVAAVASAVVARLAATSELSLAAVGLPSAPTGAVGFVSVRIEADTTFLNLLGLVRDALHRADQHAAIAWEDEARRHGQIASHLLRVGVALGATGASTHSKCSLSVSLEQARGTLLLVHEGDPCPAGERIADYLVTFLTRAARSPERPVCEIDLLTDGQRMEVVDGFNAQWAPLPDTSVPRLFERHAVETPHAIAVIHESEAVSYRDLNEMSNRFAAFLRGRVAAGSIVAIAMERSPAMVACILGIWKARCAYLPLDLRSAGTRARLIIESAAPALVVTNAESRAAVESALRGTSPAIVDLDAAQVALERESSSNVPFAIAHSDLAYVMYTSGSTGAPKGAMVEHGGMLNHIQAKIELCGMTARSVVAQNASHCFDISIWQWFAALCCGGTTVIYSYRRLLDIEWLLDDVARRISHLEVVPSFLNLLLDVLERRPREFAQLRLLISNADTLHREVVVRWFALCPRVPLCNTWGITETSDDVSHHTMFAPPDADFVPVGRTIRNMAIYVVDGHMRPCPIGVPGEIVTSGIGVGAGYLGDPERTAQSFMTDPFRPERGRLYRTGDLGRMGEDGVLEFIGRADHQVKVRGFRVELEEIEQTLRRHPEFAEAVVVARRTSADSELHCHYVAATDVEPDSIRTFLAESLPDYMIPLHYVRWPQLPLNENGKVDRRALRASSPGAGTATGSVDPTARLGDQVQQRLHDVFVKVLGHPRVGPGDDFFAIGGDSLKAIRAATEYGPGLLPLDIFNYPTISALARQIQGREGRPRLLQCMTPQVEAGRLSIIAVPNSAGDPVSFQHTVEALGHLRSQCRVYGLTLPREPLLPEDTALTAFTKLVAAVVAEISESISGPLFIFGQCNGSALALGIAEQLQAIGRPIVGIGAGGMLPRLRPQFEDDPFRTREKSEEVLRLLTDLGATMPSDPEDLAFFLRDFRYDAGVANAYFNDLLRRQREPHFARLKAPLYCFIGERDPLTQGYARHCSHWHGYAEAVHLIEFSDAGHYLLRDCPRELGRVFDDLARGRRPGKPLRHPTLWDRLLSR